MTPDLSVPKAVEAKRRKTAKQLYWSTRILFAIGVAGQLAFAYYIIAFYGGIAFSGYYEKANEVLGHGVIAGDRIGNRVLAVHLLLAAVITLGGPVQFIPAIRRRFPAFHRWNGRIYFVIAFVISLAGLTLNFIRGAHGGVIGALGNGLNASLIMAFSAMAWRTAVKKDFRAHKKWALRAFLMISGVWFLRVGYGLWVLLMGFKPVGMTAELTGPYDRFLLFAHSLMPLLIIEFYFYAKQAGLRVQRWAVAFFGLLCVLLAAGLVMVGMIFWMPRL